jgi:uncharacterized ferredoxin-like protein
MPLSMEENLRTDTLKIVGGLMCTAARTAPKVKGIDNLLIALVETQSIEMIADKMKEIGLKNDNPSFLRDAENVLHANVMMIIGTKIHSIGLKMCGHCGFANCAEKEEHPNIPCTFNAGDLGVAIGSAVSVAMDHRVDNRIMYTVGHAVIELGLLGKDVKIAYGIPLSSSAKNPFFDRK